MATKRYFTAEYPDGLTRSQFRRLSQADKRDVMMDWFGQNYEDPANRTPFESAEGGYQYIYGGPFDAREELEAEFGGVASEKLISEIVEELEHDTHVWTHTFRADDYDDDDDPEQESSVDALDQIAQQVAAGVIAHFGDAYEAELRKAAKASLARLLEELARGRTAGIGHNNPPEAIDEVLTEKDRSDIERAAVEISASVGEERPDLHLVVEKTSVLRDVLAKAFRWAGRKLDVGVDGFMKKAGERLFDAIWVIPVLTALGVTADLVRLLTEAYGHVVTWLHVVTLP